MYAMRTRYGFSDVPHLKRASAYRLTLRRSRLRIGTSCSSASAEEALSADTFMYFLYEIFAQFDCLPRALGGGCSQVSGEAVDTPTVVSVIRSGGTSRHVFLLWNCSIGPRTWIALPCMIRTLRM